jgi:Tol biopolymer transport system component
VDWTTGDLAVRDLETGTNRRLTNKGPWEKSEEFAEFSRWSPNGKQIAYDWYDGKCCIDLHVIAPGEGNPRVLLNYENNEWMQTYDWSPDSKQILIFLERENGTYQIVLVSEADGSIKVIKTFNQRGRFPGRYPQAMRFSPDGQYIAYDLPHEDYAPEHDIFLISADGKREFRLIKHLADDRLIGWSPDGKGILFSSDRTGSVGMWFLAISDGKARGAPELVRGGLEQLIPMGISRNGAFYYAQGLEMFDVYVATMDPQSGKITAAPEKAITRFEGLNSWADYSHDGKYLAYLSTRSHLYQANRTPNILCIRSIETGEEKEFNTKFRRLAGTRWAPDGKSLYLAAWDNQVMGIYRVNAQSGDFDPIVQTQSPASLHRHEISSDGNVLFYGRREKAKEPYRIVSQNLTSGEEKQLYSSDDRTLFSISPDGQRLALINQNKKKMLQVMPVSGGEPRVLLRFEETGNNYSSIEWSADGKYIFFVKLHPTKENTQIALWRIGADGGDPEELNLIMSNYQDLRAHRDGQHLLFDSSGLVRKSPAIWVMENYLPQGGKSK